MAGIRKTTSGDHASHTLVIRETPLDAIHPYEDNPRVNDAAVDAVAASIREFGWRQPIVVDRNGVIVMGHTRLKAAQKLGLKTAPVHVADNLTDDQTRALRLADNKTAELASWDYGLLDAELAALTDAGIDMAEYGFTELAMDDLESSIGENDVTLDRRAEENASGVYIATFNLPAEKKSAVNAYRRKHGDAGIVAAILAVVDGAATP